MPLIPTYSIPSAPVKVIPFDLTIERPASAGLAASSNINRSAKNLFIRSSRGSLAGVASNQYKYRVTHDISSPLAVELHTSCICGERRSLFVLTKKLELRGA